MSWVLGCPRLVSVTKPGAPCRGQRDVCCGCALCFLWAGPGLSGFLRISSFHPFDNLFEGCAYILPTSQMAKLSPIDIRSLILIHAVGASWRQYGTLCSVIVEALTIGGFPNNENLSNHWAFFILPSHIIFKASQKDSHRLCYSQGLAPFWLSRS